MLSYHNDENLKNLVVLEMKKHQEQDQFIKGTYIKKIDGKFKGCSEAIGIPEWLSRLQDKLFEGLPKDEGSQFSIDFLSAIPVGVDLESIKWKFCSFILKENIERVLSQPNLSKEIREKVVNSIRNVLKVHESAIETGKWDVEAGRSAAFVARSGRSAVESAGTCAAWSVAAFSAESPAEGARSAAQFSAWSAAESAAWSAESTAWSAAAAAESTAWSAAAAAWSAAAAAEGARSAAEGAASMVPTRSNSYKKYSVELIRLLKSSDKNFKGN